MEHINSVRIISSIQNFKVKPGKDPWGQYSASFNVIAAGKPLRVAVRSKFSNIIEAGGSAQGVVAANCFMNGWINKKDGGFYFQVEARPSGLTFTEGKFTTQALDAWVEGKVVSIWPEWALLDAAYSNFKTKEVRNRPVSVMTPVVGIEVGQTWLFRGTLQVNRNGAYVAASDSIRVR